MLLSKKNFYFHILIFSLFLIPFSIQSKLGGISANYFFLTYPIILILINREIQIIRKDIFFIFIYYTLALLITLFYDINDIEINIRRILSFVLFISIFSFVFIRINNTTYHSFFISFIIIGLFLSLYSINTYFMYGGGAELGFRAKATLGTSRYGFIYSFLFFFVLLNNYPKFIKFPLLIIFILGIFLTYSRSSVLSFGLTSFLLFIYYSYIFIKNSSPKNIIIYLSLSLLTTTVLILICYIFFYNIFNYYTTRGLLLLFHLHGESDGFNLFNYNSSEGYRFLILSMILDYLNSNNFFGSGFLGIWYINSPEFTSKVILGFIGSAHSQYFDVLIRTGYVGLLLYLYILFRILFYFFRFNKPIFWGLISIFFYSFFHETFKMSYGSFLFAFLISIYSNNYYEYEKKI